MQPTDSIRHYGGAASARDYWVKLCLLWLAGVALRLTLLAIPPIIPMIQRDLQLSGTEIGILSGLPAVLFGAAALPGSALIGRFGALSTLIAGVIVTGIASALRGAMLNVWALYAATIMMSAGIAIMQPSLPPLVRQWLPQRVTFATAVFTNGLLVGEVIAVMLTIPLVLPIVNGSWRAALAVWSLPIFLIAAAFIVLAPRPSTPAVLVPTSSSISRMSWRNKQIWQLGFVFGSVNSVYFCSNAFLPGHLAAAGRPDLIGGALTALNFGQLPASLVLLAISTRFERRALPFVLSGALMLLCLAGIVMTAGAWTIVFAAGIRSALCRGAHARLCPPAALDRAVGRGPHVGCDVHHQLQRGSFCFGAERHELGSYGRRAVCVSADCNQHAAAVARGPGNSLLRCAAFCAMSFPRQH